MRAGVLNAETLLARSTKTRVINGRTTKAGATKSESYKKRELQKAGATKSASDQSGIYNRAGYKKR